MAGDTGCTATIGAAGPQPGGFAQTVAVGSWAVGAQPPDQDALTGNGSGSAGGALDWSSSSAAAVSGPTPAWATLWVRSVGSSPCPPITAAATTITTKPIAPWTIHAGIPRSARGRGNMRVILPTAHRRSKQTRPGDDALHPQGRELPPGRLGAACPRNGLRGSRLWLPLAPEGRAFSREECSRGWRRASGVLAEVRRRR